MHTKSLDIYHIPFIYLFRMFKYLNIYLRCYDDAWLPAGKLSEVERQGAELAREVQQLNSSAARDRELQQGAATGLQRLGDSLASLRAEMVREEAVAGLREQVASLGAEQLSQEQEITRSQGRLNQLERDITSIRLDRDTRTSHEGSRRFHNHGEGGLVSIDS